MNKNRRQLKSVQVKNPLRRLITDLELKDEEGITKVEKPLRKSSGSKSKRKIKADAPNFSKVNGMELGVSFFSKNGISLGFVFACYTSRQFSPLNWQEGVQNLHKRLAYQESLINMAVQVAVYALLKTAIEAEVLVSHDRHNPSPVKEM
ncbi:hypothetical protein IMY05_016G0167300 [Salix suchowensis]|nr:hypothetical protein IMY05_016G0167300 [Salix suchowensis]